jgi:hypothetical protein
MVERPIKKSERQASSVPDQASSGSDQTEVKSETRSSLPPPIKDKERKERKEDRPPRKGKSEGGRGKGAREELPAKPANLALMRGPKPVKPKLVEEEPVAEAPEAEAESVNLEAEPSASESSGSENPADAPESPPDGE